MSTNKFAEVFADLIANSSENGNRRFVIGSSDGRRVFKIMVDTHGASRKHRTSFVRAIAYGYDEIELPASEFINRFRTMPGNVDADLGHRFDRLGTNLRRLDTGAFDLKSIAGYVTQNSFSHLAAGGVSGAENQNAFFVAHDFFGTSQLNTNAAKTAPSICAAMKAGTSDRRMPVNVSVNERARVTAGFANDVDEVNQHAAVI